MLQLVTLLMYLGTVKHRQQELVEKLDDDVIFSKETRHRFKCVFQVMTCLTPYQVRLCFSILSDPCGKLFFFRRIFPFRANSVPVPVRGR
jgi:hypothetical protein